MNRIHRLFSLVVLSVALVAAAPTFTGCATNNRPLAEGGVYQGDNTLYNADKTISEAYDVMHKFVTFEYQNREALAATPDVRKHADTVRLNAQQWIKSAIALRDVYAQQPTAENRDKLSNAIKILREAITQASAYLAKGAVPR